MNLNLSVIMFVKITCRRTFWLFFFNSFFFYFNSLGINRENMFVGIY